MKIDVTQKLLDLSGEEMLIVVQGCPVCGRLVEDKGVRTLRNTLTDALNVLYQDEPNLSGQEKFERHLLAVRIHSKDEPEFTVEELKILKDIVAKRFAPAIMGPVWMLLDPKHG